MDTKRIRAEIDLDAIEYNADAVLAGDVKSDKE